MSYTIVNNQHYFLEGTAENWTNPRTGKIQPLPWAEKLPKVGYPVSLMWHRTGNPDASARSNVQYFRSQAKAVSHDVIQGSEVYSCVDAERIAWHCNGPQAREIARQLGLTLTSPRYYGGRVERADMRMFGMELVEETEPSGSVVLPAGTVRTAVERAADIATNYQIPEARWFGHSELAPKRRGRDPNELIHPNELREMTRNLIREREEDFPQGPMSSEDIFLLLTGFNKMKEDVEQLQAEMEAHKKVFVIHAHKMFGTTTAPLKEESDG